MSSEKIAAMQAKHEAATAALKEKHEKALAAVKQKGEDATHKIKVTCGKAHEALSTATALLENDGPKNLGKIRKAVDRARTLCAKHAVTAETVEA